MRKLFIAFFVLVCAQICCSCGSSGRGLLSAAQKHQSPTPPSVGDAGDTPPEIRVPGLHVYYGFDYLDEAEIEAYWGRGEATVTWDLGGGAEPNNFVTKEASGSARHTIVCTNPAGGEYHAIATVEFASGETMVLSCDYDFSPKDNAAPELSVSLSDLSGVIEVEAIDPEGGSICVYAETADEDNPQWRHLDFETGQSEGRLGFSCPDVLNGGSLEILVSASDRWGANSPDTSINLVWPAVTLAPDTLYAIPDRQLIEEGEDVLITVASGVPAHPFLAMNGCRVIAPAGFEYVNNTFNVGMPGGEIGEIDGFWSRLAPTKEFLLAPDIFFVETPLQDGRTAVDFNLTPINGTELYAPAGALFNFRARLAPGVNKLDFEHGGKVKRCYYSDSDSREWFWGDISNEHDWIANCVVVE